MTLKQRKWVFATSTDFLILIYLQLNVVDLRYFKLWILLDQIILNLGYKDIGIIKFEFVAKTKTKKNPTWKYS